MHSSSVGFILKEGKIRLSWIFFCIIFTSFTCYWFAEDFFFLLSKPFLQISKTSFFICTQITESLSTYIVISLVFGFFFSFPYISYQIWCFFIPSCTSSQRSLISKIAFFSLVIFVLSLVFSFNWILPNIWFFLYKLSNTEAASDVLIIKLQPKIYDFSILTLRTLLVFGLFSQIPIMLMLSIQYKVLSFKIIKKNRRTSIFVSSLVAAFITPPDLLCQFTSWIFILFCLELAFFCSIIQMQYQNPKSKFMIN